MAKRKNPKQQAQEVPQVEPQKPSVERAILKEYFNDKWITVLWKAGGAIFGFIMFGFGIGLYFGSLKEKKAIQRIETTQIIRDTVILNTPGEKTTITLDSLLKMRNEKKK